MEERDGDQETYQLATAEEKQSMVTKALKSKFTFRLVCLIDGTWKYKVRLVACGYSQVAGHDFNETFAPTAKFKSICIILNLAAIFDISSGNFIIDSIMNNQIYYYCCFILFDKSVIIR